METVLLSLVVTAPSRWTEVVTGADEAAWWAGLEATLLYGGEEEEDRVHEFCARLTIFADWLEDRGDPRAAGMRRAGTEGRAPVFNPSRPQNKPAWEWWLDTWGQGDPVGGWGTRRSHRVRKDLFDRIRGESRLYVGELSGGRSKDFFTLAEATSAMALALAAEGGAP